MLDSLFIYELDCAKEADSSSNLGNNQPRPKPQQQPKINPRPAQQPEPSQNQPRPKQSQSDRPREQSRPKGPNRPDLKQSQPDRPRERPNRANQPSQQERERQQALDRQNRERLNREREQRAREQQNRNDAQRNRDEQQRLERQRERDRNANQRDRERNEQIRSERERNAERERQLQRERQRDWERQYGNGGRREFSELLCASSLMTNISAARNNQPEWRPYGNHWDRPGFQNQRPWDDRPRGGRPWKTPTIIGYVPNTPIWYGDDWERVRPPPRTVYTTYDRYTTIMQHLHGLHYRLHADQRSPSIFQLHHVSDVQSVQSPLSPSSKTSAPGPTPLLSLLKMRSSLSSSTRSPGRHLPIGVQSRLSLRFSCTPLRLRLMWLALPPNVVSLEEKLDGNLHVAISTYRVV